MRPAHWKSVAGGRGVVGSVDAMRRARQNARPNEEERSPRRRMAQFVRYLAWRVRDP